MSTRRSLAFSFLDRYASLAIGIVSSMILARLLTPGEVGIFSVTMAVLALVATVRDLGAGQYLLQEKELTKERIRAVWAVQLGVGTLLGGIVFLCSRPLAAFYDEPRMRDIMLLLALNYVINPIGSVTYAWLMREMRYDAIAVVRFSSTLTGSIVSVWLASRGYGPVSLAWGSVLSTIVNAGMSMLFRPSGYPWIPGWREVPRVLAFGTSVTTSSIISTVSSGAPEFLLGKIQSLAATGYYSRANGLVSMFNRLVTDAVYSVALSLFSKESRESRDSAESFIKALGYITVLGWSFAVGLVFLAHPTIRLLYGTQWDASVNLTRLMAGAMAFTTIVPLCIAALVGAGAVRKMLWATGVSAVTTIAAATAGAIVGLMALGVAMLLSSVVTAAIWLSVTRSIVKFEWGELWTASRKSALVATAGAIGPATAFVWFGAYPADYGLPLLVGVTGAIVGFFLGVRLFGHPIGIEFAKVPGVNALLRIPRIRQ